MAKRVPLLRQHVGKTLCSTWGGLKLCVKGGKYGFFGELHGKSGKSTLPVPTGEARTPQEAMREAKRFLDRAATKRN